jgi:hypothetical protein
MRARFRSLALLGLTGVAQSGCLLYMDPINERPQVQIDGPSTLRRGEPAMFVAHVRDDEGGPFTYDWGKEPTCPETLELAVIARQTRGQIGTQPSQQLTAPDKDAAAFCAFVIVSDRYGAKSLGTLGVTVVARQLEITGPEMAYRNQQITFTASFKGEPADVTARASFRWAADLSCEAASVKARGPTPPGAPAGSNTWTYPSERVPFCVVAVANDTFGVEHEARHDIRTILNRAPVAGRPQITPDTAGKPFGLFSEVRISGAEAQDPDGDELTYDWKLFVDGQPKERPPGCGDRAAVCIINTDELVGTYRVQLAVGDGAASSATTTEATFKVRDAPPCIQMTMPDHRSAPKTFLTSDDAGIFTVSQVVDDGDPQPSPLRSTDYKFVWSVKTATSDGFLEIGTTNLASFPLPSFFRSRGDSLQVRVEYRDRLTFDDPRKRDFSRCDSAAATCALEPEKPECHSWVTWTVVLL